MSPEVEFHDMKVFPSNRAYDYANRLAIEKPIKIVKND